MPDIPVNNCCGCTACAAGCPVKAITMKLDEEGFLYPQVDLDRCIACGLCEQVCPMVHQQELPGEYTACVVAQNLNVDVLDSSTSGGFIDALYQHVQEERNGVAVGVDFDDTFLPVHRITKSYESAKAFRNSKYAQSDLNTVFVDIKKLLDAQECVAFAGTPCQVMGLKNYLGKEYPNLFTADLVCRSVPSPALWRAYLNWQEVRTGQKIRRVSCRKKTYGYHSGTLEIEFCGGKSYSGSNRVDYFMKSFHHDICSRPSCYVCPFKTKHRCSDFTVFDSWNPLQVAEGMPEDNDWGYSNVLVHTKKGAELLRRMKNIVCYEANPEKMFKFTGGMESQPVPLPKERETFYRDLKERGFYKTVKKYIRVTWQDRLIEGIKPIWYFRKRMRLKK